MTAIARLYVTLAFLGLTLVFGSCVQKKVRNERYGFKTGDTRYLGNDRNEVLKNSAFLNPDPDEAVE